MENKFELVILEITSELADQRIDKALATLSQIATRSQASRLLEAGRVRLNGKTLKPSFKTTEGEKIEIEIPLAQPSELIPYEFALKIPYEDSSLLVVDKPAGLVVHPAAGHAQDTLVNALLHHTKDLSLGFNEQRPGLVHRIDKGTSGLLVIAKTDSAQRFLATQFARKTTHRIYRALTYGKFKSESGTIRSEIRRHPEDRKRMASGDGGKPAVTHYKVLSEHPSGISLVELKLETGRTHQIRVHLSEMGHPIVGDVTYGAAKRTKNLKSVALRKMIESLPRFALHAMELGFVHPVTHKQMTFAAPWPDDLLPLLAHFEFPVFSTEYTTQISEAGKEDSTISESHKDLPNDVETDEDDFE